MSSLLIFFFNLFFLIISSYHDIKSKIIPNRCVLCMLASCFAVNAVTVLSGGVSPGMMTLLKWVVCPVIIMLFFFPAEMISGKRLGHGDKKVLMVLSLSLGFWGSIFLIFGMLAGAAIYYAAVYVLNVRKLKIHEKCTDLSDISDRSLPMAPFILAAYFMVFFLYPNWNFRLF